VELCGRRCRLAIPCSGNVRPVGLLRDAILGTGTKLVLLSTDNVFDGTGDMYVETDSRSPVNTYGRTKCAAEDTLAGRTIWWCGSRSCTAAAHGPTASWRGSPGRGIEAEYSTSAARR
jgi:hypothetical protein